MALTVFSSSQLHRRTRRFTQRFLRPKALASEAERPILKGTVVRGTVLPQRSIWYQNASLHDVHFSVCLCVKSTPNIFRILGYFRYSYEHILFSVKFAWNASVERLPTFCLLHSNRLNMVEELRYIHCCIWYFSFPFDKTALNMLKFIHAWKPGIVAVLLHQTNSRQMYKLGSLTHRGRGNQYNATTCHTPTVGLYMSVWHHPSNPCTSEKIYEHI